MLSSTRIAPHPAERPAARDAVITFGRPTDEQIDAMLAQQRALPATHPFVRASLETPLTVPDGWDVDHPRERIGTGRACFERARAAISNWRTFELGWVELHPRTALIEVGVVVAPIVHVANLTFTNACRIEAVIDERTSRRERFGFLYDTLPEHAERGEERFTVELDRSDDSVWYDILAFSRPRRPWVRAARPLVRRLQARFAAHSLAAVRRAVREGEGRAS